MTKIYTLAMEIQVIVRPDRDFVGGLPRIPATYTAYATDGRYWTAFVMEYSCQEDFERDAIAYFNRQTV